MIDAETQHIPTAEDGGWPSADRRGTDRPFASDAVRATAEPRMPRRDNPLVAGLVKAMREAAVASRDETSARLQAEANARVEAIKSRATGEAAGLRKRADEDVSAIREWSKAEVARIKVETDTRYLRPAPEYHRLTTPDATAPRRAATSGSGMSRATTPRGLAT